MRSVREQGTAALRPARVTFESRGSHIDACYDGKTVKLATIDGTPTAQAMQHLEQMMQAAAVPAGITPDLAPAAAHDGPTVD